MFRDFYFYKVKYYCILLLLISIHSQSQTSNSKSSLSDSLTPILVQAFSQNTKWKDAAAAVALIQKADLNAYAPNSLVPVLNNITGVRMEERSPGSYRLSIRGSLLRSAFGVRNTKIYWNDFPISDATGNTYLNLIDISQIDAAEILKGPSGSIYGVGTGSVVLLKSLSSNSDTVKQSISSTIETGSYGLFKEQISWKKNTTNFHSLLNQSYTHSDGFREQSALKKYNLQYQASLDLLEHQLSFLGWFTNLNYQTAGGITFAQMQSDPRLSRQATVTLPSAIQQNASIFNNTFFGGLKDKWKVAANKELISFITIHNTQFENPFITNYEFRNETNAGIGSKFIVYASNSLQWMSGFEWLYNHSVITDFGNKKGIPDTLQFNDQVFANQWTVFSQLQKQVGEKFEISAGISMNQQQYQYQRVSDISSKAQFKSTKLEPAPRFAIRYDFNQHLTAYGIVSYGFSPASLAELRPSDGNYYGDLAPEKGWNFEFGIKGYLHHQFIQYDLAYYHFKLNDAIVRRNNSLGAEYYVNAGTSLQQGLELTIKATVLKDQPGLFTNLKCWISQTYQPYQFLNYQQGNIQFNGNWITGVPRNILVMGTDFLLWKKLHCYSSINCVSKIPLTDANDAFANAYQLLQFKIDYPIPFKKTNTHIFAGIDNALNQIYSLGNDINAAGKRFYNPAPPRNLFVGIHLTLDK